MEFMMPEWIRGKKILTAEEVKNLPVGATVYVHKVYGNLGEHLCARYTVTQSENKKVLTTWYWYGNRQTMQIKDGKRVAFTAD